MIYITGDTHGGVDMIKLSSEALEKSNYFLTANDHLIITGDFGFPFTPDDLKEYEKKKRLSVSDIYLFFMSVGHGRDGGSTDEKCSHSCMRGY